VLGRRGRAASAATKIVAWCSPSTSPRRRSTSSPPTRCPPTSCGPSPADRSAARSVGPPCERSGSIMVAITVRRVACVASSGACDRRAPRPRPAPTRWERHGGAASPPLRYHRREPEKTLLYTVVRKHRESFLAQARERISHGRGLPAFVERELRSYTVCGVLARGIAGSDARTAASNGSSPSPALAAGRGRHRQDSRRGTSPTSRRTRSPASRATSSGTSPSRPRCVSGGGAGVNEGGRVVPRNQRLGLVSPKRCHRGPPAAAFPGPRPSGGSARSPGSGPQPCTASTSRRS
jgi:hypothetical protein